MNRLNLSQESVNLAKQELQHIVDKVVIDYFKTVLIIIVVT